MSNINPDKKIDDYHSYFYNNQIEMTDFVKEKQEREKKHQHCLQEKKQLQELLQQKEQEQKQLEQLHREQQQEQQLWEDQWEEQEFHLPPEKKPLVQTNQYYYEIKCPSCRKENFVSKSQR